MKVQWYWHRMRVGFRVTYHLRRDFDVVWRDIFGVQVGGTFIGIVRSAGLPVPATREEPGS